MIYRSCSWRQSAWSVLLLYTLSISPSSQAFRAGTAEIVQEVAAKNTSEVEYQRLNVAPYYRSPGERSVVVRPHCTSGERRGVIDNEEALRAFLSDCQGYKLPEIDFSKHTLVVMSAETDLCQRLRLKVIRDDAGKRYWHIITANRPMRCRGYGHEDFWVLIPKMVRGYEVRFEREVEPGRGGERWRCDGGAARHLTAACTRPASTRPLNSRSRAGG